MELINISTESKSYPVFLGSRTIDEFPKFIKKRFTKMSKMILITDKLVADLHLSTLEHVLKDFDYCTYITPIGEAAKTFEVYYDVLTFALEQKLDRNSVLLAFGGGAIGDLGGFIASTFMRGIPFIQIPTTILAHDSAVGGKVAINHPVGKNMIGSFYQPEAVIFDLDFIQTLSLKEKRSGFAEVIKHSLIHDNSFYNWLVQKIRTLETLDMDHLQWMLSEGIKVKRKFVSNDEREQGERAFLNLGHTLGHAIEAEMGYGKISHGEAVIIGMIFALKLSIEKLNLEFDLNNFIYWLKELGYHTSIPNELSIKQLIERMKQDKKSVKEEIRMVLLSKIGQPVLTPISEEEIIIIMRKSFM
ncbi:3-dehydroquinate synthase [Bacillus sp. CGMCC 1.16607]|uniref:3-dehydroquinate synthase n=1 Tax=Bacillus sp. CGMCC 1.16607 TaxID=3351842 RepID=UPI003631D099